jgi:hypothetical protein
MDLRSQTIRKTLRGVLGVFPERYKRLLLTPDRQYPSTLLKNPVDVGVTLQLVVNSFNWSFINLS